MKFIVTINIPIKQCWDEFVEMTWLCYVLLHLPCFAFFDVSAEDAVWMNTMYIFLNVFLQKVKIILSVELYEL